MPFTAQWWNGPVFWPLQGSLAFSEHLVGLSVVTTPLIWMGAGPPRAYNIAFLLSWPLSALSAHALAYRLTGRHDAGFVAGLIFGFNPYRAAQTPHIQVLASWWMPLALLALHDALIPQSASAVAPLRSQSSRVCWLLQVLSNGYLLFYFSVLVVLWLGWFATRRGARITGLVAVSLWTVAAATIAPVLLKYRAVHAYWGLRRTYGEIVGYSGDVLSFFTAASSRGLWRFRPGRRARAGAVPGHCGRCDGDRVGDARHPAGAGRARTAATLLDLASPSARRLALWRRSRSRSDPGASSSGPLSIDRRAISQAAVSSRILSLTVAMLPLAGHGAGVPIAVGPCSSTSWRRSCAG